MEVGSIIMALYRWRKQSLDPLFDITEPGLEYLRLILGSSDPGALSLTVNSFRKRGVLLWSPVGADAESRIWVPSFLMRTHLEIGLSTRWLYMSFCGIDTRLSRMVAAFSLAAYERSSSPLFPGSWHHQSVWISAVMVGVSIISVFAFSQWKGMFSAFSHAYGQFTSFASCFFEALAYFLLDCFVFFLIVL